MFIINEECREDVIWYVIMEFSADFGAEYLNICRNQYGINEFQGAEHYNILNRFKRVS